MKKIIERKEVLQEKEEQRRTLINAMPDIVVFKDGQGRYLEANDFNLRFFGLEGVDYRGKTDSELAEFTPFYHNALLACVESDEKAWKAQVMSRSDEIIPRPDGSTRIFDVIKVPTFHPDGSRKGLIVIGHDVTERKQAEEELRKAHAELERRVEERTAELRQANRQLVMEIEERRHVEEELKNSHRRLDSTLKFIEAVISAIPIPLFYKDTAGRYLGVNDAFADLMGHTPDYYKGKTVMELWPGEFAEMYHKKDLELMNNPIKQVYEFKVLDKNGEAHQAIWCKDVFRDENGQVAGVVGAFQDITERKQAEETLRAAEEEKSLVLDSSSDLIVYHAADMRVLWANRVAAVSVNETQESLKGRYCYEIWHQRAEPCIGCPVILARDTGQSHEAEISSPDGRHWFIRGHPVKNADGKVVALVEFCLDITKRKQAEEALRISKEKYRLAVENASDAIFVVQDGMIKFPNRQTMALSGYTENELKNAHFSDFIHPDDKDRVIDLHRRRLQGEDTPSEYSFRIITKSGHIVWVEINVVKVTWEGSPAILTFLRDITLQKKLEAQLLQSQKMEAIGQFAGGIAHDFNNLLTAIIGYGHLLQHESSKDARLSAYAGHILSAAERAAILTNDLLTFSRKQIVNFQPASLNTIIKRIESLLLRVIGEDIELSTVLIDNDLAIMADTTQIDQILMNLVTNAQDAMPRGGVLIIRTDRMEINGEFIKAHGYGNPGSYALLSVEDTGIGMNEEIVNKIYEPFFTTKEIGKGTGLGLAMVYGIVKQHNGYIDVYSEPGKGTTVKILFPLIQATTNELASDDVLQIKGGTETILIGEDDPRVRNLLKEILLNAGYRIFEAVDGNDAIAVFDKNKDNIHLLILDVIMPKKNGNEVYEEIKKIKPDIKAIFVSGYSENIISKKGILKVGMNFISKPIVPDELLIKVRSVLDE